MKLRKCLLWQTQRPSVSGLRHGLEMSIRFRDGLSTGKRNIGWIHPFDSFPPCAMRKEKRRKERKRLERFHGIHRKIRGTVNVAQQAG